MNRQLLQVANFLSMFQHEVFTSPVDVIGLEELELRKELTRREEHGFLDAFHYEELGIRKVDKVKALDAITNRLYCLLGDAHTLGLAYLLPVAFQLAHNSNLSKLWTARETRFNLPAGATGRQVKEATVGAIHERLWHVIDHHGRTLKSPSYRPPSYAELFDSLAGQELLDFEHATKILFGDEPAPDPDEYEICLIPPSEDLDAGHATSEQEEMDALD